MTWVSGDSEKGLVPRALCISAQPAHCHVFCLLPKSLIRRKMALGYHCLAHHLHTHKHTCASAGRSQEEYVISISRCSKRVCGEIAIEIVQETANFSIFETGLEQCVELRVYMSLVILFPTLCFLHNTSPPNNMLGTVVRFICKYRIYFSALSAGNSAFNSSVNEFCLVV